MIELVGYFAMGTSVLSFAFSKQKIVRGVNLIACLIWVYYGFLIQNNPTMIVNVMVCMVHLYWFIKRWCRITKVNRRKESKIVVQQTKPKETREEFFKRFDSAWDNKEMWGGEYGEGI